MLGSVPSWILVRVPPPVCPPPPEFVSFLQAKNNSNGASTAMNSFFMVRSIYYKNSYGNYQIQLFKGSKNTCGKYATGIKITVQGAPSAGPCQIKADPGSQ